MQKSKGIKIAALLGGAAVAIIGMVLVVSHFLNGQEAYRSILIYELNGTASIEREGAGNIRAAEDLYLESGDRLTVADGSSMRLKLDDDKYAMVEENSILAIEAAGNEQDSKTKIDLVQGAITSEIQNPLSTDSKYEVNSPNSVMAVRGTIFRVEVTADEEDGTSTNVAVFSGKVSMNAILPDGTLGDEIFVAAGEEASCIGDSASGPVLTEPTEIDFEALPLQALNFLLELSKRDAPITGISKEDLNGLVEEAEALENEDVDSEEEADAEDDTDIDEAEDTDSAEDEDDDDSQTDNTASSGNGNGNTGSTGNTGSSGNSKKPSNPGTTTPQKPGTTPQNPGTTTPQNPGTTPQKPGTTTPQNPGTTTPQTKEYTVTFMYKNEVFATQTVKEGECAQKPLLEPATSGKWDFKFSTKIKKDTTIKWK